MKNMAATGGLMMLLVGCYPAQKGFDPSQTTLRSRDMSASPQPSVTPSWQHSDRTPVWPPSEPPRTTTASATGAPAVPLFGNSPLSPYSASAKMPTSTIQSAPTAMANPALLPTPLLMASSGNAPGASPFQQLSAASRSEAPAPFSPASGVVRADLIVPDPPANVKRAARPDSLPATEPAPPGSLSESKSMPRENFIVPAKLEENQKPPTFSAPEKPAATAKEVKVPSKEARTFLPTVVEKPVAPERVNATTKTEHSRPAPGIRMVNSKRIQFNYKVEEVGPSGVASIEMWFTTDGHRWQKCDNVSQVGSCCVAEVAEEGTYGFTLVARSGSGHSKEPPKSGDLPQVWVEVDLTAPRVELNEVNTVTLADSAHLEISWNASDRNLSRRPITLSYAETSSGPWTIIAANLENSGKHAWVLPAKAPAKLLIKVEAADLVGNVGSAHSKRPIALDLGSPSVSILDVEAAAK